MLEKSDGSGRPLPTACLKSKTQSEEIRLADGTVIGASAAPLSVVTTSSDALAAKTASLIEVMAQFDSSTGAEVYLERRAWIEPAMLVANSM